MKTRWWRLIAWVAMSSTSCTAWWEQCLLRDYRDLYDRQEYSPARVPARALLQLAEGSGDAAEYVRALHRAADVELRGGSTDGARELYERAIGEAERRLDSDAVLLGRGLAGLGKILLVAGDASTAESLLGRAIDLLGRASPRCRAREGPAQSRRPAHPAGEVRGGDRAGPDRSRPGTTCCVRGGAQSPGELSPGADMACSPGIGPRSPASMKGAQ
jgi:hypothetical protein